MSMTVILPTRVEQVTPVAPVLNLVTTEKPVVIVPPKQTQEKELDNGE